MKKICVFCGSKPGADSRYLESAREFGKLIEPKNYNGWAIAMNELIENKEIAQTLGENGRNIAERDFTIERFNRDIVFYIQESLNNT